MSQQTATASGWSPETHFAAFWSDPNPGGPGSRLASDVVGRWPNGVTLQGVDAYNAYLRSVIALMPDVKLEVIEHAINGDLAFIRWRSRGTGSKGPFEMTGIDRLRFRDGRIVENMVYFDTVLFRDLVGKELPAGSETAR